MITKYFNYFLMICCLLFSQQGFSQYIHYPAIGNMHIEIAPGMYNPDTFYLAPGPAFQYIQDYIHKLSITDDIDILNLTQNNFGAYRYGSGGAVDTFAVPLHCGRFVFDSTSEIGIDSGIILNSGNVYYAPALFDVLANPYIELGPGSFPGVCWPASFNSSGLNYGANPLTAVPFTNTIYTNTIYPSAHRDAQYPELVAMNNGDSVWDANVLDFDFVPKGPYFKLQYVFGSEEYGQGCGYPTDVMGIFLSGPGINGQQNIAVLSGSNTPVNPMTVYPAHSACRGEDTSASPYYVNNTGGQNIIYDGFTKVMTAYAAVTPCDTYHLRIAVADGALHPNDTLFKVDWGAGAAFGLLAADSFYGASTGRLLYDSGIMLKDHSFRSTDSLWLEALGGSDHSPEHPYAVRGCLSGSIRLYAATPWPIDRTFHLNYGGDAQVSVDYAPLSNTVVMPANDTFVDIPVTVLWGGSGTKALKVGLLSPYGSCYQMSGNYLDSTTLFIGDGYVARIEPRDTSICTGCSFPFHVMGENFLQYSWSPAAGLSNPNIKNPVANPQATTLYTLTVTSNAQHPCPGNKDSTWVYVGATGIGEMADGSGFSVSPNPFRKGFQINLQEQFQQVYTLSLFNVLGQKVYSAQGTIKHLNRGVNNIGKQLNSGTYFIELKSDSGHIFRKEMVKW